MRIRVLVASLATLLLSGVGVIAPALSAQAWVAPTVTGSTACDTATGKQSILWTVKDNEGGRIAPKVSASTRASVPVGTPIPIGGSKTFTEKVDGPTAATLSVTITWYTAAGKVIDKRSGSASVKAGDFGECKPPQPKAETESRDQVEPADCEALTVTTNHQERSREYTWKDGKWVAGEWSEWKTTSTSHRDATAEECPLPNKPEPVVTYGEWSGSPDCEEGTYTQTRTVTTTDWVLDGRTWVKGEPVTTTETVTREATAEECPAPQVVTVEQASATAPSCEADGALVMPQDNDQVTYTQSPEGTGPGTYTITAHPAKDYVLPDDYSPQTITVEHRITGRDCQTLVKPVRPDFKAITECGTYGQVILGDGTVLTLDNSPVTFGGVTYGLTKGDGTQGLVAVTATPVEGSYFKGAHQVRLLKGDLGEYTECPVPVDNVTYAYAFECGDAIIAFFNDDIQGQEPVVDGTGTYTVDGVEHTVTVPANTDGVFIPLTFAEDSGDHVVAVGSDAFTVGTDCKVTPPPVQPPTKPVAHKPPVQAAGPVPAASPRTPQTLAYTGANATKPLVIGGGLVLLGLAMVAGSALLKRREGDQV